MRTVKGAARNQAKKRLFRKVKGFVGARRKLLRTAKETLIRAGVYAYRDRRNRKREFRKLWIIRINAAVRQRGHALSEFIAALTKAKIEPGPQDPRRDGGQRSDGLRPGRRRGEGSRRHGQLGRRAGAEVSRMALSEFLAELDDLAREADCAWRRPPTPRPSRPLGFSFWGPRAGG